MGTTKCVECGFGYEEPGKLSSPDSEAPEVPVPEPEPGTELRFKLSTKFGIERSNLESLGYI